MAGLGNTCAIMRAKVARKLAEAKAATTIAKTTTAIKAGFVGSAVTVGKAVFGNIPHVSLNELARKPLSVALDYMAAVGRSAKTGFKVSPMEFRTLASSLDADGIPFMMRGLLDTGTAPVRGAAAAGWTLMKTSGGWQGVREGIATFVEELSARLDADFVTKTLDHERIRYQSPLVQTMVDGAFAALEAADRPFYQLSFNSSMYAQAKLMAMKEGLSGGQLRAATQRWLANPTDEMLARATDDAMWATFKDRNILSNAATDLKRNLARRADMPIDPGASAHEQAAQRSLRASAKVGQYVVETNLPFTGVPSSVAAKVAQQTPLGILSLATAKSQQQLVSRIASMGVGAALWTIGYELAADDRITAGAPDSPNERAQWDTERRQPWSIRVGRTWVDIRTLGPVAAPLFMGAMLHRYQEDEPEASAAEAAARATGASARFLVEQTYLQSVARLIEAAKDERKAGAIVSSQVPLPSALGQLARATDPLERDPQTIADRVASRIPGLSRTVPARRNVFGEPIARSPMERVAGMVSPFQMRTSADTPLLAEMRRLGVTVGKPSRTIRIAGEAIERTREEYTDLLTTIGPATRAELEYAVTSPEYAQLADEERAALLLDIIRDVRRAATDQDRARRLGMPEPTDMEPSFEQAHRSPRGTPR
jgi:hypothetical protein